MKKLIILIIILMYAASMIFLPILPQAIPMHWNISGQVDSWWPKNIAVWLFPAITSVMFLFFRFFPSIDPRKEKYKLFRKEWEIIQTVIITFMAYMQFIIFYIALHPGTLIMPLMFIGLGTLFIVMGNYLSKIRQNYFIGIRIPWTLSSEDNWNKTHRFASWTFVGAGILMLAEAYFLRYAPGIIFSSILLAVGLPIIYSFLLFRHAENKMNYVLLALLLIITLIIAVRLFSGEDNWICSNGKWIEHGKPSAPKPTGSCGNIHKSDQTIKGQLILITPNPDDNEDIITAFSRKYDKPIPDITVAIDKTDSIHASGSVHLKGELDTGIWYAANTGKEWEIVFYGMGVMSCHDAEKYNFPVSIVSECIDQKTGLTVNR